LNDIEDKHRKPDGLTLVHIADLHIRAFSGCLVSFAAFGFMGETVAKFAGGLCAICQVRTRHCTIQTRIWLMDPKQIVADGYDYIAEQHEEWASNVRMDERAKYTAVLLEKLSAGAEVLELGCGSGIPTTEQLAERFVVTGVDISARQIELAQRKVPSARFVHADMTKLDFPENSFNAVTAFYSIIHVPRQEHAGLMTRIASWLRPGGLLVATMGAHASEVYFNDDWLGGLPMYWSNFDSETNQRMVEEAGLSILSAQAETADEFGKPVTFLWVIAQKAVQ